jgi:hypothetical protein
VYSEDPSRATYGIRHVAISVSENSIDDGSEGRRGRSVGSDCGRRVDVSEERQRGAGDRQGTDLLPLVDGVVELLGGGEGVEVPALPSVKRVDHQRMQNTHHGLPP